MRMEAPKTWTDGPPRVLVLAGERSLVSWLAATVLAPSGLAWRAAAAIPARPEAEVVVHALGPPLAREAEALALARGWGLPVLVLLGRDVEDPAALVREGVVPLPWPHAPLQVQDALLQALGLAPGHRRQAPPGAPHIHRVKEQSRGLGN